MSDLNIMGQASQALQQAYAQPKLSINKKTDQSEFATLSAQHSKDPSYAKIMQDRKIKETAIDFEAQFLSQMLQPMFEGLKSDGPFGGGHAEKMWQSMLVQEYGKAIAQSGGIGIADEVQKQLLRAQEGL